MNTTNLVDFFRILNAFIAIMAVPASIGMFIFLQKEAHIVPELPERLCRVNRILRYTFLGISIGAILNAFTYGLLIVDLDPRDLGEYGSIAFSIKNLIINTFFTLSSWSFFMIRKESNKVK